MSEATRETDQDGQEARATTPHVRPFADFVREQRKGLLHDELSDELARVVQQVDKPGEVTLKLTVSPQGDMVSVKDAVITKLPKPDRPPALYFTDDDGNLSRHNPAQPELPFRQV
jgi:hypothetical protein